MNNVFAPSTALGSAFDSIFTEPSHATGNKQSASSKPAYRPTSISAHSNTGSKICMDCHQQFPVKELTEVHPVPGLTMYRCGGCVTAAPATAELAGSPSDAMHEAEA